MNIKLFTLILFINTLSVCTTPPARSASLCTTPPEKSQLVNNSNSSILKKPKTPIVHPPTRYTCSICNPDLRVTNT